VPVHWRIDRGFTIGTLLTQQWNWNFFTDTAPGTGPNQGPIVFRAVPKGKSQGGNNTARNVLVTYDFAMCRGGPGDDHACSSSDNLRPIRHFENGGSGSSGVRV
jgi:hypothetical protein